MQIEDQNTTELLNEVTTEEVVTKDTPEEVKLSPLDAIKEKAKSMDDDAPAKDTKVKADKKAETAPEVKAETTSDIPVYSPDFKYKANGQVKEIDERLRSVIKDKDTEEWLKKTLSKADGLEEVQAHRDHIRNEFNNLSQQAKVVIGDVDSGNYGAALQKLGVDTTDVAKVMQGLQLKKEDIIKYAYSLTQLTPEQEMAQNRQRELELNNFRQQSTVETLNQRLHQQEVQIKASELRTVLSTPDYAPLVEAYDSNKGQGAFWNEVCERGEYNHLLVEQGRANPKSIMDLITEVSTIAKFLVPQAPITQAIPATIQNSKPNVVPVIPNVGGGSSSPARKKTKSVAGLKAYAQDLSDD